MNLNEMIDGFVKIALDLGADITPIENAFWIDELEKKLGKRYPASFYSLLTRYQFTPFEIDGIEFFANTGLNDIDEMAVAIFRDPIIARTTHMSTHLRTSPSQAPQGLPSRLLASPSLAALTPCQGAGPESLQYCLPIP